MNVLEILLNLFTTAPERRAAPCRAAPLQFWRVQFRANFTRNFCNNVHLEIGLALPFISRKKRIFIAVSGLFVEELAASCI